MPEAPAPLFELEAQIYPHLDLDDDRIVAEGAEELCTTLPYRRAPYSKRNWGGVLHSLCSYQGKLKPAIAHFLVSKFTRPGDMVLDPMSGVGTIPLEARIQGRHAIAGDLSELASTVSQAKLETFRNPDIQTTLGELATLSSA
jgi:RMKL-like, methyltransferase domain